MLSTQPQACPPVRFSRLAQTALASATALAGFAPLSQAAFFEDSSGHPGNPQYVLQSRLSRWHQRTAIQAR